MWVARMSTRTCAASQSFNELARVLKKTGSFYYHCGWREILDEEIARRLA